MQQPHVKPSWLEQAVFYQIYPQSFYDTNADGVGDIPGIIAKLDYLQSLGITAIWINPCFVSPFQDAGYDVSDYYKVAPRYGTNQDLETLFDEARKRGIRVLLDLVPGHTSIEHPWFQASCRHERNEYTDWFIWTDSAWEWQVPGYRLISGYSERDGAYLTNFFYFQPALNYGFADPDPASPWQQSVDAPGPKRVRQELRNIMRFWLEMGASGFRVDMAFSLVKGDPNARETSRLWQEIRTWLDQEYPEACLVSEWGRPRLAIQAGFHVDFCLPFGMPGYVSLLRKPYRHLGPGTDPYGFAYFDPSGHGNILEFLDSYLPHYQATKGHGLIAIPTGNHDTGPRLGTDRSTEELELIYLFLMTMPGTPFIYYGDEIGMRSIKGLPSKEGGYNRTEIRTPMQWSERPNAGFSTAPSANLYLPVDERPDRPTVEAQEHDPNSLLQRVRRLIALRKEHPALCASGDFEVIHAQRGNPLFVYRRTKKNENIDETILVAINPAVQPIETVLPKGLMQAMPQTLYGTENAIQKEGEQWRLRLPGVSGGAYRV